METEGKRQRKTVYMLCIRFDDSQPWSEWSYYRSRKERDHDERMNRIIGGARTHTGEEKKTEEEIADLCD